MTTTQSNRPTHRIYAVSKGKDDKSFWKDIGAAWSHKDGQGFNLRFDHIPLNGAEIVVRKAKPKKTGDAPESAQGDAA